MSKPPLTATSLVPSDDDATELHSCLEGPTPLPLPHPTEVAATTNMERTANFTNSEYTPFAIVPPVVRDI
jgi:hypothetical protein